MSDAFAQDAAGAQLADEAGVEGKGEQIVREQQRLGGAAPDAQRLRGAILRFDGGGIERLHRTMECAGTERC